ncbi:hypothetical protein WKK05_37670 (plasmid) [Nostoc sp. UHCC 0302]|uniref:hypothetical protein n=1 Tax=Nostoc sp. UHCC 0302 TaxID=3134896 RepID=UPI00311CDD0E
MDSDTDSIDAVNELLRKIRVREIQLKIAQESNMFYAVEILENQLFNLKQELGDRQDSELQSLMTLLDVHYLG